MPSKVNWSEAVQPLLKKYKSRKHPLEYKNVYQLMMMVILSAQDSDKHINEIAPKFFEAFPNMEALARADEDSLYPFLRTVRNFGNKTKWLIKIAQQIKSDKNIPLSMEELTALSGIGRKSANVIRREAGEKPQGVIVDLHVVRVAPRLGIATGTDPKKIEQQIMDAVPQKDWDVGMAMSFLGREICRPTDPKCPDCPMNSVCEFYKKGKGKS
ncbi:MAG: endonuclease III domain-containing protein [Chitinophagales bacterium]